MQGEADDIVSAIMAKWSAGFGKLDADALASLYSKNAFFFGSRRFIVAGKGLLPTSTACSGGARPPFNSLM